MADRSRKKEKHRLKRAKKQQKVRKAMSITPLMQLARSPGELECKITIGWEEQGIANIFVFGGTPGGRHALGVFLVDAWCVGLKDCWGAPQMTRPEFNDMMKQARKRSPLTDIDPERATRLVAGAIRFSRQNGFRLPSGWEKWVKIFGPDFDIAHADLSGFGKDGGLLYVGTESFLRQHLMGMSVEQFMARPDVKVVIGVGPTVFEDYGIAPSDEYEEDSEEGDDEDIDDETIDEMAEEMAPDLAPAMLEMLDQARTVLLGAMQMRNATPHLRFEEALTYVAGLALSAGALRSAGAEPFGPEDREEAIEDLMQRNHEADPDSLWEAIDQIYEATDRAAAGDFSLPAPPVR
jgi:hypothetical protein